MAPIPDYLGIIWGVLWFSGTVIWVLHLIGRKQGKNCCCCHVNACGSFYDCGFCNVICGDLEKNENEQQQNRDSGNNNDAQMAEMMIAVPGAAAVAQQQNNNQNNNQEQKPEGLHPLIRAVLGAIFVFLVAFIGTIIIAAILEGSGFLDMLLFAPTAASTCGAACETSTKDGLSGWAVNQECCTYSNTAALGEKFDLFLKFQDNTTSALSSFTVSGWLLVNRTRHYSAPTTQLPLLIMYNHGSGGNIAMQYRHERYKFLLAQGNVMIVTYDYPGYGKSTGAATATSVMASANGVAHYIERWLSPLAASTGALAGATFAAQTTATVTAGQIPLGTSLAAPAVVTIRGGATAGADLSRVVVLGRSMGGAVSIYTVRHAYRPPKGLAVQSTFTTLAAITEYYFPIFAFVWKAGADANYAQFSNTVNIAALGGYRGCFYHSHSQDDAWVPFAQGVELQNVAAQSVSASCSRWVPVASAKHTQPLTVVERTALAAWLLARR